MAVMVVTINIHEGHAPSNIKSIPQMPRISYLIYKCIKKLHQYEQ